MANLFDLSDEDLDTLLGVIMKENEGKTSPYKTAGLEKNPYEKDMSNYATIQQTQSLLHPQTRAPSQVEQLAPYIDPRIQSLLRM